MSDDDADATVAVGLTGAVSSTERCDVQTCEEHRALSQKWVDRTPAPRNVGQNHLKNSDDIKNGRNAADLLMMNIVLIGVVL